MEEATYHGKQPHQSVFASLPNNDSFVHLYSSLKFTLHFDNKGHVHKNQFGFPPAPASRSSISTLVRSEYFTLRDVRLNYNWRVFVCKWYFISLHINLKYLHVYICDDGQIIFIKKILLSGLKYWISLSGNIFSMYSNMCNTYFTWFNPFWSIQTMFIQNLLW